MDHTNVSRYQNPPEEAEYSILSHLNSKEDLLDVFVVGLMHRSSIIYVLINITLLTWLAQTIISSKIQEIPKSAYFISPYFAQQPIKDISITNQTNCPQKWEKVLLKTFPAIFDNSYNHKQMYQWGVDGNISFCVKRIDRSLNQFVQNQHCSQIRFSCSGYCFPNESQCPITSISYMKPGYQNIGKEKTIFYTSNDDSKFVYTKRQGRPIVGLTAAFHNRCSNDYKYLDQYNNVGEYEKSISNCGAEGTINSFYDKITEMKTQTFMYYNNRPFTPIDLNLQIIQLGAIHEIDFNNDFSGECYTTREKARQAAQYLFNDPVEPLFTQSLLVIGFILMIAQIIWLTIYVCLNGYFNQKNIIVILICVIELTVITFIYSQNSKVFDSQKFIRQIANCIESQVTAATTWHFGIRSSSVFTMIQYVGTIFLALYFFAYLMDKLLFEPSSQIYRNFVYDDNDQYSVLDDKILEE